MTSNEIRQQFLDFFKSKDHRIVPSAPVVPYDDPTLLFTNAGMNQFKDVFLGAGTREYKRAADTQKCIRVSGKHNDLEEVGHDTYHHTFFEMLGNWSFGDYYKKEAIAWAWQLLTEVWKLPKERLYATVYRTDDEAYELWKTVTDINPKHVLKFDEKDNFWEMGDTGPCGPCSEIHINLSDNIENASLVNAGTPECIEIWNLVFIQYNRDENGKLHELPSKHVDTGMGFERVCAVLQNKRSNYDTDVFMPIINAVSKLSGIKYEKEEDMIPMRVIADHLRTLTFAIGDGAVPGNEGRGYVLRRILRRAARYGRKINLNEPFLYKLVPVVVENMSHVFPEIKSNRTNIEKIIRAEEESFNATLDRGIELFNEAAMEILQHHLNTYGNYITVPNFDRTKDEYYIDVSKQADEKDWQKYDDLGKIYFGDINSDLIKKYVDIPPVFSGKVVFKLYDTFGFPFDLTNVMAKEIGFSIDEDGFNKLMDEQKERARKSTKDKISGVNVVIDKPEDLHLSSSAPTEFTGYTELRSEAEIIGFKNDDGHSLIVLNRSPFYAESGGQVDDKGIIIVNDTHLKVTGLFKLNNQIVHVVENEAGVEIRNGMKVTAEVEEKRRWDTMRNHSATHFLHAALRSVLGQHVQQAGSYVGPDRLRFDFTHFEKMSESEIEAVESIVNEKIRENLPMTHHRDTPFDDAKKMGALMFFGDKYGDKVNVVQFGNYTMEFCGGTHVKNGSQIGIFKIVGESSIASGVRRIEAVTGAGVEKYIGSLISGARNLESKIEELSEEKRKLEKELAEVKLKEKLGGLDSIISSFAEVKGIKVCKGKVNAANMDELTSMGDELRSKIKSGVGVLIAEFEGKAGIVCVVTDDLIKDKKVAAGKLVGSIAKILGGGGGGRPHLATAGGKDVSKIGNALDEVENIVGAAL